MILKLPKKPRLRTYELDVKDHKEFNGVDVIGEPINIGVRCPNAAVSNYIIKNGYTYLWEQYRLCDGSDFFSIWLIYPKGNRPSEIEIEDYEQSDIIDAVQYEQMIKKR